MTELHHRDHAKKKEAEALVALENVNAKQKLAVVVADGLEMEPRSYEEALARPDSKFWDKSMNSEGSSLLANKRWTLMNLRTGKRALSCRWLFKYKRNSDGTIARYNARLVMIGCQQIKYVDFDDIYAPVVPMKSLRVLLALVCINDLECHLMDIESAFLNGDLDEEVYMKQPKGMMVKGKESPVCKLVKSIYGLKQASQAWLRKLTEFLCKEGFEKLSASCASTQEHVEVRPRSWPFTSTTCS